jgi:RHS repeat-associated protein
MSFDAWGNRRDRANWTQPDTAVHLIDRGFTMHQHLDVFKLINMGGRVYDPVVQQFLSPDPYVQAPDNTQNLNRYAYCLNSPLMYTDPTGEKAKAWPWLLLADILGGGALSSTIIATAVTSYPAIFPFTNQGYEVQKYLSPIAIKPVFNFGTNQSIGIDFSFGMPKGTGLSYRYHWGASYHFNNYGGYRGSETRSGHDFEIIPFVNYSTTKFKAGKFSQTTSKISLGTPINQVSYENDWMFGIPGPDGGDRWRTAAIQMNFGPFSINLNMFTGDPGLIQEDRIFDMIDGHNTYIRETADDYRAGVLSFGFGLWRIGRNSEQIRKVFQNRFAHDFLTGGKARWFRVMKEEFPASWYWSFGTGTGGTLW